MSPEQTEDNGALTERTDAPAAADDDTDPDAQAAEAETADPDA